MISDGRQCSVFQIKIYAAIKENCFLSCTEYLKTLWYDRFVTSCFGLALGNPHMSKRPIYYQISLFPSLLPPLSPSLSFFSPLSPPLLHLFLTPFFPISPPYSLRYPSYLVREQSIFMVISGQKIFTGILPVGGKGVTTK